MRKWKRTGATKHPENFESPFASGHPAARMMARLAAERGRDAPLTPKAKIVWRLVLAVVIVGGAVMILVARR